MRMNDDNYSMNGFVVVIVVAAAFYTTERNTQNVRCVVGPKCERVNERVMKMEMDFSAKNKMAKFLLIHTKSVSNMSSEHQYTTRSINRISDRFLLDNINATCHIPATIYPRKKNNRFLQLFSSLLSFTPFLVLISSRRFHFETTCRCKCEIHIFFFK